MTDVPLSDLKEQFFSLFQFLGVYLSQDFDIFGPTLEDAVNAYIADSTAGEITETRTEIAKFLERKTDDLDADLDEVGGSYSREPGMRAREYLHWLDDLLVKGLAGKAG